MRKWSCFQSLCHILSERIVQFVCNNKVCSTAAHYIDWINKIIFIFSKLFKIWTAMFVKSVETEFITRVLCTSVMLLASERQLLLFSRGSNLFGQMCRDFCRVLVKYIAIVWMFYVHESNFLIGHTNHYTYQKTLKKNSSCIWRQKGKVFLHILLHL